MAPARLVTLSSLLLLVVLPLVAAATADGASIDIVLTQDSLTVNYRLELRENLTSLPTVRVILDASNSSAVAGPIEAAIQRLVPAARLDISQFEFSARTELLDAARNMWMMQVNITTTVLGVRSNPGGMVSYGLNFLRMNMSDSVRFANVEFNKVGQTYLLQPLQSQPLDQTVYFLNSARFFNSFIPGEATIRFNLLDFWWIPSVSDWNHSLETFGTSSTWTYDPANSPRGAPYNLTIGIRPVEETFLKFFVAVYNPTLQLTTAPRAWAEGSTVSFDIPTLADFAMPLVIVSTLALGLGSYTIERKLAGQTPHKKRRR